MTNGHTAVLEDVMAALGRDSPAEIIRAVLRAARRHLGMEVGFVGEIHNGSELLVRWLDGDHESFGMEPLTRRRLEETYCRILVRTGLPVVVSDALEHDELVALRVTHTARVRSYVGAPIRVHGETVAVVCYAGHEPRPDFAESHRAFMNVLADLLSEQLERHRDVWGERCTVLERTAAALEDGGPAILLQPIVNLRDGAVVGAEALARFAAAPSPGDWFADAWRVGYGAELELAAIERAAERIADLPGLAFLSINMSPDPGLLDRIATTLAARDLRRVVLELTEHAPVSDYALLRSRIRCLRQRGARIAVDDTGAGFAGLGQLLHIAPDFIKLDQMLVRGIEEDPMRIAMASSLVEYAARVGAELVAEGLETDAEIETVRSLGVRLGQGYRLGRPVTEAPPARIAVGPA